MLTAIKKEMARQTGLHVMLAPPSQSPWVTHLQNSHGAKVPHTKGFWSHQEGQWCYGFQFQYVFSQL